MLGFEFLEIVRQRFVRVLVLLGLLSLVYFSGLKSPLSEVHWDVPIYLYQAKLAVETPLLQSYSRNSNEIADQVRSQRFSDDEGFPEAYWHFSRLGNSLLLGLVAYGVRDGVRTIMVASWVYTGLLAISLVLSVLLIRSLGSLLYPAQSRRILDVGAVISVGLYVGSDIYRYLSGNLVSEVPALLLLIGGMLSFVKASEKTSLAWSVVSGCIAFLLYVVRLESLWTYLAGVGLLAVFLRWRARRYFSYAIIAGSAGCFCVLYGFYTWQFYPLADPSLFLSFGKIQRHVHYGTFPLKLMIASGGLLWVSALLSVRHVEGSPVVQFALAWLALQFVPFTIGAIAGMPSQTRMYSLAMPTLMILSTQGITGLIEHPVRSATRMVIGLTIAAILLVSNPLLQPALRFLPGIWRLDEARSYFALPKYEKVTYPIGDLAQISRLIYGATVPMVLVRDESIPQEYANLIRYFGPRHAVTNDLSLFDDPTNGGDCKKKVLRRPQEPVVFCTKLNVGDVIASSGRRVILMTDKKNQIQIPMQRITLMETEDLLISELKPR